MSARTSNQHGVSLEVRGLRKSFGRQEVLKGLDLTIKPGEIFVVMGPSGSGKSVLLKHIIGLTDPDEGEILIEGRAADAYRRSHAIAYLGHLPALKADLSALENLDFLCGLHGRRAQLQPEQAMAMVGLAGYEDALARQLSAGQKKRLSLARLWLSPAPLWLLDEPYANLDLEGIELVNRMVQAHLQDGGATLVTTHGAYAAPPVRTRMLVMRKPA